MLDKISPNRKNQVWFIIFTCLSIFVMVLIFLLSNQRAEESEMLSDGAVGIFSLIIEKVFSGLEWIAGSGFVIWVKSYLRKIAHFTLYAVLGTFLFSAVLNVKNGGIIKKLLFSLSICLVYSITDEVHQLFVPGRSGELTDVMIDFGGSVAGVVFVLLIYNIFIGRKNKNAKKS